LVDPVFVEQPRKTAVFKEFRPVASRFEAYFVFKQSPDRKDSFPLAHAPLVAIAGQARGGFLENPGYITSSRKRIGRGTKN
jgi:hypothetical protein